MDFSSLARFAGLTSGVIAVSGVGVRAVSRKLVFPAPKPGRSPKSKRGALLEIAHESDAVVAFHFPSGDGARTIVWFHGNGEQIADVVPVAEAMNATGLGVLLVEYPGYGLAGGRPSESALYSAASAAIHHLHDVLRVSHDNTVIIGQSIGTGVAVEMAKRGLCTRLGLISPFTSLRAVAQRVIPYVPMRLVLADHFDSIGKAPSISIPVHIVHGDRDELIPIEMGRAMSKAFSSATLDVVRGAGHNDLFSLRGEEILGRLVRFATSTDVANVGETKQG